MADPIKEKKNEIRSQKETVGVYAAIEAFGMSEGGQKLLNSLLTDITNRVSDVSDLALEGGVKLQSAALALRERLLFYRSITNAPQNRQVCLEELRALEDELKEIKMGM